MPRSWGTTSRIVALFILFYTAVTLALGVAVYLIGDHALRDQLDGRLDVESDYLVAVYNRNGMAGLRETLLQRDDRGVNDLGYLLVDRSGRRLGGELPVSRPADGWSQIRFATADRGVTTARALTVELANGSYLTVAVELAPAYALQRTAVRLLVLGFGAMLLGGIIGGILLVRVIRGRLNVMNRIARAIISGDMTQRVPSSARSDEFDRLARTLNTMLDRNGALIENLRQVSSDIAHDLRTPLARLRHRLERISSSAGQDYTLRAEVERAIEEADATLSLFSALLRIAEVESGALRKYFRQVDLSALVRNVVDSYAAVAEDSGRTLGCSVVEGIVVLGDKDLLSQAMVNLLENALRHTPVGTHVQVMLDYTSEAEPRAALMVRDNGPGVPSDQWPMLTRRFTRANKARSGPGFGLGLNLVQAVARVHDATLTFGDARPGLIVSLDLPTR